MSQEIEQLMLDRGAARGRSLLERMLNRGGAADTAAARDVTRRRVRAVADRIDEFVVEAYSGKPIRRAVAAPLLLGKDSAVCAYLALRGCVNGAVARLGLSTVARTIGAHLNDELVAAQFEDANPRLYQSIIANAAKRGASGDRVALAVRLAVRKFGLDLEGWGGPQRVQVGMTLAELALAELGDLVEVSVEPGKTWERQALGFTPAGAEWFAKYNEADALSRPLWMPTLTPPRPWAGFRGGGYPLNVLRPIPILARSYPAQRRAIEEGDMARVYGALNSIQDTPWAVNSAVLAAARRVWDSGVDFPGLPPREDQPIPEPPPEVHADVEGGDLRRAWRRRVSAIHRANVAARTERFTALRTIQSAAEMARATRFYYPHRLDFRGRAYPVCSGLNPQGDDLARSLLHFADGLPLGEHGEKWLAIHGANCYGVDKVTFAQRQVWAYEHTARVIAIADDPLADLWWTEADKPWCFLAWCFEWAAFWDHANREAHGMAGGRPFLSHLPIALDGSCNGIQHFSAMLRDPVGGAAVNLVPADQPQDIYEAVAAQVREALNEVVGKFGHRDHDFAYGWYRFGVDRKITKRAVMVLPYGGTFKSCLGYVGDAVREKIAAGAENPFGDGLLKAIGYLARLVWAAIAEVVVGAREAMDWLQRVARIAAREDQPVSWVTPSGFPAHQEYRDVRERRVITRFRGSTVEVKQLEPGEKLDRAKQASSIAPNFVHSLDASAMMLTVNAAVAAGIKHFAMIHDSYGTHAGRTEDLARILRAEFVRMYEDHDVLAELRASVAAALPPDKAAELPEPPAQGSLKLREVLDSQYFFA